MMGRSLRNAFMVVLPPFYYFLGNVPHKNYTGLPFFVSSVFLKRNIFLSSITFSQMDFCAKQEMHSNILLQTKRHKYYPISSTLLLSDSRISRRLKPHSNFCNCSNMFPSTVCSAVIISDILDFKNSLSSVLCDS